MEDPLKERAWLIRRMRSLLNMAKTTRFHSPFVHSYEVDERRCPNCSLARTITDLTESEQVLSIIREVESEGTD